MLWKVRTTLADRPGALAALAARCGDNGVNILSLQIFPHLGGVTDEVLLSVPGGWDVEEVSALVAASGGELVSVGRCSERALVDPPTKHLRVALRLLDQPNDLAEAMAELLDVDVPADRDAEEDVVQMELAGSNVEVRRPVPFTEVERARAAMLAEFAQWALTRSEAEGDILGAPRSDTPSGRPSVRRAKPTDSTAVRRMHERCSTETLSRRYHSPMNDLPQRWEQQLLGPEGGASYVAAIGDRVVGMVVIAPHEDDVMEVGILVEDGWQQQGIGATLLHTAATYAAALQKTALLATMQPGNPAVLPTIRRCGLTCRVRSLDGTAHVTIPLTRLTAPAPKPGSEATTAGDRAVSSNQGAAVRIG